MKQPISITAISSISPLGYSYKEIWENYLRDKHFISCEGDNWVSKLSEASINEIECLKNSEDKYRALDDSVLYAIYASRNAVKKSWLEAK